MAGPPYEGDEPRTRALVVRSFAGDRVTMGRPHPLAKLFRRAPAYRPPGMANRLNGGKMTANNPQAQRQPATLKSYVLPAKHLSQVTRSLCLVSVIGPGFSFRCHLLHAGPIHAGSFPSPRSARLQR